MLIYAIYIYIYLYAYIKEFQGCDFQNIQNGHEIHVKNTNPSTQISHPKRHIDKTEFCTLSKMKMSSHVMSQNYKIKVL